MGEDVKPKVRPEWVAGHGCSLVLRYDDADKTIAANVCPLGDGYRAYVWRHNNMWTNYRTVDSPSEGDVKAAAVKAIRDAGYSFVGDPEPGAEAAPAKPAPKGRIVRRWVDDGSRSHLYHAPSLSAAIVGSIDFAAWHSEANGGGRIDWSSRGGTPLDDCKAVAERWLTNAGYELVEPVEDVTNQWTYQSTAWRQASTEPKTEPARVKCRYLTADAVAAVEAELAGGRVPLGCVEWAPAPGFRLFEPGEMMARARELVNAIEDDYLDKSLWARLAALAMVNVAATTREARNERRQGD